MDRWGGYGSLPEDMARWRPNCPQCMMKPQLKLPLTEIKPFLVVLKLFLMADRAVLHQELDGSLSYAD